MKLRLQVAIALTLALLTVGRTAADAPKAPAGREEAPSAELKALERFLSLPDEELAQMADAIARVRALSPAQRAELRDRIAAFRQLPEAERRQLRQGWRAMPAEIQHGWREMMQAVAPAEREAIQSKLQSLAPEEKMRYRRTLVENYLRTKAARK